jgi:hypothetical protein
MSKAGHGGPVTGHVAVPGEMTTHGATQGGLCETRRVLCTPHMSSCLCMNWTMVSDVWILWKMKSAPSASGEYQYGGARGVRGCGVGACDCVFHGASHAFVVVFRVSDVSAVPGVWCVAAAG